MEQGRKIFSIISCIAFIVGMSVLVNVFTTRPTEKTFGERLVLDHYRLNTPFYNFHFKSITVIVISAFVFWTFGLESLYNFFVKKSLFLKRAMFIFFFLTSFVFFFEVLQTFAFWSATYTVNLGKVNVDELHTDLSPSGLIVNFTAMTKFYTFIFFWALYGIYFFHRIIRDSKHG